MKNNARDVVARCKELQRFWAPRNEKMKAWYRLIQMVDELKTEKLESFVGNDPRSMYNLVLHMLDTKIPHRLRDFDVTDFEVAAAAGELSRFLDKAWDDVEYKFRRTGPRQSLKRTIIGLLLATGWYSAFRIVSDTGQEVYLEPWHPAQTYPMWDGDMGLSEVAHIFDVADTRAKQMARRNGWDIGHCRGDTTIYDYWWTEIMDIFPYSLIAWNAVVVNGKLVKFEPSRFSSIPVEVAPVGGLPDTGPLSEGSQLSASSYNAGAGVKGERWKEEIGQAIVATNENIYRVWNKWWTFSLQLLRDTAQPRVFERSRSGKPIIRPEDVFRRGAIFRGGPDDSVEFIGAPPVPLEIRSTQLDLEAMMQRGGVSWAMFGNLTGQVSAYVMSQIAASANQIMRPFHQALQNLFADIDNAWVDEIRQRGVTPYGWKLPPALPKDARVIADFDVEIPGDLVQRATAARMLHPAFQLSYSYVARKLFPEIKNPAEEKAMLRADEAERDPRNALIAYIDFCRKNAAYLEKIGDSENAELYRMAGEAALAQLGGGQQQQQIPEGTIGARTEGMPTFQMPPA